MAPTLVQNRRPDWHSRSVRSRFDVTALTLPSFPCAVARFWRGIKNFEDLTKSKNFCAKLLHKLALIILAKNIIGARCTLIKGSLTVYRNSPIELIFFSCLFVCFFTCDWAFSALGPLHFGTKSNSSTTEAALEKNLEIHFAISHRVLKHTMSSIKSSSKKADSWPYLIYPQLSFIFPRGFSLLHLYDLYFYHVCLQDLHPCQLCLAWHQ